MTTRRLDLSKLSVKNTLFCFMSAARDYFADKNLPDMKMSIEVLMRRMNEEDSRSDIQARMMEYVDKMLYPAGHPEETKRAPAKAQQEQAPASKLKIKVADSKPGQSTSKKKPLEPLRPSRAAKDAPMIHHQIHHQHQRGMNGPSL